jgi:hypothetical protein
MLDAADRLLAADPGNLRALATSVYLEKPRPMPKDHAGRCSAASRQGCCPGPDGSQRHQAGRHVGCRLSKAEDGYAPIFDSAIAQDDENKKDFAGAIAPSPMS